MFPNRVRGIPFAGEGPDSLASRKWQELDPLEGTVDIVTPK